LVAEGEGVAAVIGLGDRPATDVLAFEGAVALDQLLATGHLGEDPVHTGDTEADGEPRVSPAQLLVDEATQPRGLDGVQLRVRRFEDVEAQRAVLLEDVPEHRAGRAHVGGVGEHVELGPRRPHHLFRELASGVADLPRFVREIHLDVRECHRITSVGLGTAPTGLPVDLPVIGSGILARISHHVS
jgi:hypothetical protein